MTGTAAGLALVAAGGALGSALRAALTWAVAARTHGDTMPATLAANVLGSFVIGVLVQLAPADSATRLFLATGVCGGFTTFSTFSAEAIAALEAGRVAPALGYAGVSLAAALLATWAGFVLGRAIR
jgi:CrcB protein